MVDTTAPSKPPQAARARPAPIAWNAAVEALPFSPIRKMFNLAARMTDVLHLSIGQPDFPTPPHIIEAFIQALHHGKTAYELDKGNPALREAIANFYNGRYGCRLDRENVLITTGCFQSIFMALTGIAKPGGEVILVEPHFVFSHLVGYAGATIRAVRTTAANGYQVDAAAVIAAMNERTCAVLINSPGNPTGAVYPEATMRAICDAARERTIPVISDEVYDRLILDGSSFPSALAICDHLDRVVVTSSVSKTYAMPGLRIGWAISSHENIDRLQRYHMFISTTENTPSQIAAAAAFSGDQTCVDAMVAEYRRRRDRVVAMISASKCLTGYQPGGAFFVMPSMPQGVDSFDVAERLLAETNVCVIPGGAFGASCNNALRISYSTSMEKIEAAFERMIPWLDRHCC